MARVRLYRNRKLRQVCAGIPPAQFDVWHECLFGIMYIAPERFGTSISREFMFDTGAPLTVFPRHVWTNFEAAIDWLTPLPPVEPWVQGYTSPVGGFAEARLGRVSVQIMDQNTYEVLPVKTITAKFLDRETNLHRVLLGLGGDSLQHVRCHSTNDGHWVFSTGPGLKSSILFSVN